LERFWSGKSDCNFSPEEIIKILTYYHFKKTNQDGADIFYYNEDIEMGFMLSAHKKQVLEGYVRTLRKHIRFLREEYK
jgi:hypothetical protein